MFEKFSDAGRQVIVLAQEEARRLQHQYIGTEHILLGLIREGEGLAAQAMVKTGADLREIRRQVFDAIDHRKRAEAAVQGFLTEGAQHGGKLAWATHGRRRQLVAELNNLLDENERLHDEVARLREKLRQHDLDPDA